MGISEMFIMEFFEQAMQGCEPKDVVEWLDNYGPDVPAFVWYAVRALEEYAEGMEE